MTGKTTTKLLATLDELKRRFGRGDSRLIQTLRRLSRARITDAESLIQFHEALLFLRAYPPNARTLKQVETQLKKIEKSVAALRKADADLSPLEDPAVSGISGTSVTSNFSYALVRWLARKYPRQVSIDWDWFEEEDRFGATMPRFLPLLEEDAMVEAHVPYRDWLEAASGRQHEVGWIIEQFESLSLTDKQKAEAYDALKLHITWQFGARSSRTEMTLPVRKIFFHDQPLITRRDVSLTRELNSPPIPIEKLSTVQGEKILDLARETSAVRYRELHGFTNGDPKSVLKAELGRGVQAFVLGVRPENRLPLRAYHAAIIFKNGVPVAYFEGLSLCERMESGFNHYYTFRDGETAWLYARILHLMRQLLGVTVISIDPYQVGHENEEGIESGAFWFYRKLGFRPVKPELMKLTRAEEQKMESRRAYRSSARTLRRLAAGHMIFELFPVKTRGEWDRFSARRVGLAVQKRMARDFGSDRAAICDASIDLVTEALAIKLVSWSNAEKAALANLALPIATIAHLDDWEQSQKQLAVQIIRAKAGNNEARYLKLMQKHAALRRALIRVGS